MNDQQRPVSAATAGAFAFDQRAIRLLLANDEHRFFDSFRTGLDSEFEVVATAGTSAEALRLSLDHQPDVILLGSCQPGQETASLRRLKALPRPPKLLVLTDHDDEDCSSVMLAAGADVCLSKSQFPMQWRSVIRRLALPS